MALLAQEPHTQEATTRPGRAKQVGNILILLSETRALRPTDIVILAMYDISLTVQDRFLMIIRWDSLLRNVP